MNRSAIVTGASSGVGRAIAVRLAHEGWEVGAVARRPDALRQTAALAGPAAARIIPFPCDIADEAQVRLMARAALARLNAISILVNAAGINTPRRALEVLSFEDYRQVVDVNLTGAFLCIQAFLPGMREQNAGTIVNISSDAGIQSNAKAGAAYVVSKFGLRGLTQSINLEERQHGIRACAIFPGDINTPLLDKRPVPPPAEARKLMLQPEDVAACAMLAINLPQNAVVEELLVRPR
jgi:NAD(P)-dependent dehydrogenase (short-subunit alcohol dehydrogenase family)